MNTKNLKALIDNASGDAWSKSLNEFAGMIGIMTEAALTLSFNLPKGNIARTNALRLIGRLLGCIGDENLTEMCISLIQLKDEQDVLERYMRAQR